MKLIPRVRSTPTQSKGASKSYCAPSLQNAAPHPCQLRCKVKDTDGNEVASVPICLPLSIMASCAVKAAAGSDELARIASVAVIDHGNAVVSRMRKDIPLSELDVNEYIDAVATNTRNKIMSMAGDPRIADEVETMIRGGGQIILDSNKDENVQEESRDDDDENDLIASDDILSIADVQSIATSVLNNLDRDMMMSAPNNGLVSQYATNDTVAMKPKMEYTWGPSGSCSTTVASSPEYRAAEQTPFRFGFWAWNCSPEQHHNEVMKQVTQTTSGQGSLDKVLQNHSELLPPQTASFDPTWGTSNSTQEYEATSTFNLDTFTPVPQNFYQIIPHDFLGCPNLSMEPVPETKGSEEIHMGTLHKHVVRKAVSSEHTMDGTGHGIFAISSNHETTKPAIPAVATSARVQPQSNLGRLVSNNADQSSYNPPCSCPGFAHTQLRNDQDSTNGQTYQSFIEPGKEVDDITYLNAPKKKQSLFNRVKCIFGKLNCKTID